jgi:hypothetical protein
VLPIFPLSVWLAGSIFAGPGARRARRALLLIRDGLGHGLARSLETACRKNRQCFSGFLAVSRHATAHLALINRRNLPWDWQHFAFRVEGGRLLTQEDDSWVRLASLSDAIPWYRWKSLYHPPPSR